MVGTRFDSMTDREIKIKNWLNDAEHVIVLNGAGISTECGIPNFRGPKGFLETQAGR